MTHLTLVLPRVVTYRLYYPKVLAKLFEVSLLLDNLRAAREESMATLSPLITRPNLRGAPLQNPLLPQPVVLISAQFTLVKLPRTRLRPSLLPIKLSIEQSRTVILPPAALGVALASRSS